MRWVLRAVLVAALCLACFFALECWLALRCRQRLQAVRIGETREEVRLALGEPTEKFPTPGSILALFQSNERWVYGPRFVSWTADGPRIVLRLFDQPLPEDCVVEFGPDGKVTRVSIP